MNSSKPAPGTKNSIWISALTAAAYAWLLDAFHWCVSPSTSAVTGAQSSTLATVCAALLIVAALGIPFLNLVIAGSSKFDSQLGNADIRARRFALLAVTSPTAYVFFGVVSYMAGSKVPDPWIWTPVWLLLGFLASRKCGVAPLKKSVASARVRVAHGISGALVTFYVMFHVFNHLCGLISPEAHAAVMEAGRTVYRYKLIEPLLVVAMLFQAVSGLRLLWQWTATSPDRYRMVQIASGAFLAVFILGHMNSVFIYARLWMNIPTDWAFATGLPTGLIHDPWNIRLAPHYALGVFFVLAHLVSGLRVVLLAHDVQPTIANRLWQCGVLLSAAISAAIIFGMCGIRVV